MRLIKMTGGLGNQMFIYAFYLQMRHRFPKTRIDLSDMMHYNAHNGYELHRIFDLPQDEVCWPRWLKKVMEFLLFKVIVERKQNLDTLNAFQCNYLWPFIYFKGFYQSERFFKEIEEEIHSSFRFNLNKANDYSKKMAELIQKDEHSVSLHVRRGDYISPKFYARFGSVCQLTYYERAIQKILSADPNAHFYIFSDDIRWVEEQLHLPHYTIIDGNHGDDSWQDMMLMSFCRRHIIANSTFSWWGAWLDNRPGKMVIAPQKWLGDREMPHIIPQEWIKIATD